MFCLRIHTLDPRAGGAAEEAIRGSDSGPFSSSSSSAPPTAKPPQAATETSRNPNPRINECRGFVHLYRNVASPPTSPYSLLPEGRGTVLFVVAVPSCLSTEDLYRYCCSGSYADHFLEIWIIRNDATEDRFSVLITLDDQKNADRFYYDFNRWPFPSVEAEICHILFIASVEYTDSFEIANTPPSGSTELPTCPVCLERLDQDTSGIITTGCDHSFQCSCISKWANSSCQVCRLCQEQAENPMCSICETTEKLWICMICGFVGCGRYKEGHASKHWIDTQHCYSLDLEAQRVWDYVGDTYVHRLNQSKSDEKLGKMKMQCRYVNENCETCGCSVDSGISGALYSSKVEAIVDEYNHLLSSQLEIQRQYYESLLLEARGKREKVISEAVEKAISKKLKNIHLEIENTIVEKKRIADINDDLIKNQTIWREKIKEIEEREKSKLKLMDEKIHELKEEIRDYKVFLEAQKTLDNEEAAEEIREGTVMPVPSQQSSHATPRRSSKMNRRRH